MPAEPERPLILLRLEQLVADMNKAMTVAAEQGVRVILDVIRIPSETPPCRIELREVAAIESPAATMPSIPAQIADLHNSEAGDVT